MSRENVKEPMEESLEDKAYDLLGDMLVERNTARYMHELEEDAARGEDAEMEAFFARQDQENLKKIQAYARRRRNRRFLVHMLPRMAQVAAVIIALVSLAGSVAIATSQAVRVQVMKLLLHMEAEYTELRLVEDEEASFDVPAEWQGSSYPAYIPEGLQLKQMIDGNYVVYRGETDKTRKMSFSESDASTVTNIDTEDATVRAAMIQDHQGYLAVKEDAIHVFWSDGLHYYIVSTSGIGDEKTVQISQSVTKIR